MTSTFSSNQSLGSFLSSSGGDSKGPIAAEEGDAVIPEEKVDDQDGVGLEQTGDIPSTALDRGDDAKETAAIAEKDVVPLSDVNEDV
ncbi:hypothetical protein QVD17_07921 [Tagetes erecta]|uniref:Uncharacterized protein n=1 Tax=Tagetes erecta TaxID=13708 RepID=A0AAD8P4B0_TARER|nr:hypothetical protein QVD17_07921 [Tagetes erecta]